MDDPDFTHAKAVSQGPCRYRGVGRSAKKKLWSLYAT